MPARPTALTRPVHPSWCRPEPAWAAREPAPRTEEEVAKRALKAPTVSRLTRARVEKRLGEESAARDKACQTLAEIIGRYSELSSLAKVMKEEGEAIEADSPSLRAALESRKTGTLTKRAGSLRLYERWFRTSGLPPASLFAEQTAYRHLEFLLQERVGATRGQALTQAMNFAGGLLGFDVRAATSSPRVKGLVVRLAKTRAVRRQRAPLTVPMVAALEELACSGRHDEDATLAGAALFGLYARARVGDLRRSQTEPVLDLAPGGREGYVQGAFLDHKTAKAGTKDALPVVGPLPGVTGKPWAEAWLDRRRRQRLKAEESGTLLPAPAADGGWAAAPQRTAEFGVALRALLLQAGFEPAALENIGAHSLKATALSWLAKAGTDRDTRRVLGYHVRADERSMEAYSRDALAGPLRTLAAVIGDIRAKRFEPDATRSGRFVAPPPSSTCSSSGGSDDESSVASGDDGEQGEASEVAEALEGLRVVQNVATRYCHTAECGDRLSCGKPYPMESRVLDEPPAGARLCKRCF